MARRWIKCPRLTANRSTATAGTPATAQRIYLKWIAWSKQSNGSDLEEGPTQRTFNCRAERGETVRPDDSLTSWLWKDPMVSRRAFEASDSGNKPPRRSIVHVEGNQRRFDPI